MTADVLFKKEREEEKTNKLCYFLWLFFVFVFNCYSLYSHQNSFLVNFFHYAD